MQKYLVNTAGMDAKLASAIMTVALFVFMLLQPAVGAFSDKIGRRSSMLIFSAFATVLTVPILFALKEVSNPYMAFGLIVLALFIISFTPRSAGCLKPKCSRRRYVL